MSDARGPKLFAYAVGAVAAFLVASGALSGCSGSTPGLSTSQTIPAVVSPAVRHDSTRAAEIAWRHALVEKGLPTAGCFQATYPSALWERIGCSKPPRLWFPRPRSGNSRVHGSNVGGGNDYTAQTSSVMSEAIGWFPKVTDVTHVVSTPNPSYGNDCECGADSYTLQLNSNFFSTAACGSNQNCNGWEQFVYANPPGSSWGSLFIQDWLVSTKYGSKLTCPAGAAWMANGGDCYQNSAASIALPNQPITALSKLEIIGKVASSGDSVYLRSGTTIYGIQYAQSDTKTDLLSHWTGAEFNLFGNGGGSIAVFNSGATVEVGVGTLTGKTTAPTCRADSGTTAETNSLTLITAPANPTGIDLPSILFAESNVSGGGTASCDALGAT